MVNDYVVMDIETTGLNPKSEKIIELGAARIREGKVVDTFSAFVNPGRSLSDRIVELTGISAPVPSLFAYMHSLVIRKCPCRGTVFSPILLSKENSHPKTCCIF